MKSLTDFIYITILRKAECKSIFKIFLLLLVAILTFQFLFTTTVLAYTNIFPEEPMHGMQINYSISGANPGSFNYEEWGTWKNRNYGDGEMYDIDGYFTSDKITIFATAFLNHELTQDDQAWFSVQLDSYSPSEGNQIERESVGINSFSQLSLDVSMSIPEDTTSVGFIITLHSTVENAAGIEIVGRLLPGDSSLPIISADEVGDEGKSAPWGVVTGGMAAVAAAAAAVAARSGKSKKEKDEREQEEQVGYVLQLSTDSLKLASEEPASFQAAVWQVDSQGGYTAAGNALLQVEVTAQASFIQVTPSSGQGTLQCHLSLEGEPLSEQVTLKVVAEAGGTRQEAAVRVEIMSEEAYIETYHQPEEKTAIRPDGKDGLWLYARVVIEEVRGFNNLDQKSVQESLTFTPLGGNDWLEFSEPQLVEDWSAIWVQASTPDPLRSNLVPPPSVTIGIDAQVGEKFLSARVTLDLLPLPRLEVSQDTFDFLVETEETLTCRAFVEDSGEEPWEFSAQWRWDKGISVNYCVEQEGPSEALLELTEAGHARDIGDFHYTSGDLRIIARQGEVELVRQVQIILNQEGLYASSTSGSPQGDFRLKADGEQEPRDIDFRVLIWNPERRWLEGNAELVQNLSFEIQADGDMAKKALEVGELEHQFVRIRSSNLPSGTYRFLMKKEVPGAGELMRVPVMARVMGREKDEGFSREFVLGIQLKDIDPQAHARQVELERCQKIIDRHVPEQLREEMQALLDKNRVQMGAEELYMLRWDIYVRARDAWLAEGAGYLRNARLYEGCEYLLSFAEWAGDKAFEVVVKYKLMVVTGGNKYLTKYGTRFTVFIKGMLTEALIAFIYEGKRPDQWLDERIGSTLNLLGNIMQDIGGELWVSTLEGITPERLNQIFEERTFESEESIQSAAELYDFMEYVVTDWAVNEAKKEAKSFVKKRLEKYELKVYGRRNWSVTIPVWVIIWVIEQIYSFYDNYCNKNMTVFEAARKMAWDTTDSIIWGYVENVALHKGWGTTKDYKKRKGGESISDIMNLEFSDQERKSVLRGKLNEFSKDIQGMWFHIDMNRKT